MNKSESSPGPKGKLMLRTYALPKDTNGYGNIFAGWIMSQLDQAAASAAEYITRCRVVTVAIEKAVFVSPIKVGSLVCMYTEVTEVGRSSIRVNVEVWAHRYNEAERHKVTESQVVLVAVDENGHSKTINHH